MLIAIRLSHGVYQTALTITRGESVDMGVQILQASGDPVDLTGYGMKAEIDFSCSGSALILDTDNGGIVITDATAGKMKVVIDKSDTAGFQPGEYSYDL